MDLYNRNARGGNFRGSNFRGENYEELGTTRSSELGLFIKKTYQLFAASMLAGSVGAYVGLSIAPLFLQSQATFWILFIVEIGLLIALQFKKREAPLNLILLFGFTFCSGLTLTPLLYSVLLLPQGAVIIAQAFALTTVAFAGLSIFAMNTRRDFTVMGKALFIVLIVVIAASLINLFFQSGLMNLAISAVAAVLFSFYILYDTQNIIRGNYQTPIEGAVALYLDFLNLFISLLNILRSFNGR